MNGSGRSIVGLANGWSARRLASVLTVVAAESRCLAGCAVALGSPLQRCAADTASASFADRKCVSRRHGLSQAPTGDRPIYLSFPICRQPLRLSVCSPCTPSASASPNTDSDGARQRLWQIFHARGSKRVTFSSTNHASRAAAFGPSDLHAHRPADVDPNKFYSDIYTFVYRTRAPRAGRSCLEGLE